LYPITEQAHVIGILQRTLAIVRAPAVELAGFELSVKCSIGAAIFERPQVGDSNFEPIIHLADMALYRAKKSGRDCGYWGSTSSLPDAIEADEHFWVHVPPVPHANS
jgi:GGDEF domain-containing protein